MSFLPSHLDFLVYGFLEFMGSEFFAAEDGLFWHGGEGWD